MIIAIPDDYHGVVTSLDCLSKLSGHTVRVLRDVAPPPERLVQNLRDAEVIVPVRERTRYTREIIERLPRLKLFSQEELFERSDVLVLMARLSSATRGIVTAEDLARMKPTALLVNTARAQLVAPGALTEALKKGRPGFAALDVYEKEPVRNGDHPLLGLDNALCTPHTAWLEKDTYEAYFGEAFDNLLAFLEGKPIHIVNPEVLSRSIAR